MDYVRFDNQYVGFTTGAELTACVERLAAGDELSSVSRVNCGQGEIWVSCELAVSAQRRSAVAHGCAALRPGTWRFSAAVVRVFPLKCAAAVSTSACSIA